MCAGGKKGVQRDEEEEQARVGKKGNRRQLNSQTTSPRQWTRSPLRPADVCDAVDNNRLAGSEKGRGWTVALAVVCTAYTHHDTKRECIARGNKAPW